VANKDFDVLIQKNGRIQWMSVPGCNSHAEAREQGKQMYAGKVIQTRFNGIDYGTTSSSKSRTSYDSSSFSATLIGLAVFIGIGIFAMIWPLVLGCAIIYGAYKLYKWIIK